MWQRVGKLQRTNVKDKLLFHSFGASVKYIFRKLFFKGESLIKGNKMIELNFPYEFSFLSSKVLYFSNY